MTILSRLKRSGVNAEAGNRPYVSQDDYPTQMRKRTQKVVNDMSPQVQSELVRPYKAAIKSYAEHEYYQVPQPGIEPWPGPTFPPIPLPSFRVQTPIFSVAAGTYSSAQTVQIVCLTPGATIYYTLDNTEPHQNSVKYVTSLVLSADTTLKAKAFKSGWDPSNTATAIYVLGGTATATIAFTDAGFGTGSALDAPWDFWTMATAPSTYVFCGKDVADVYYKGFFWLAGIGISPGTIINSAKLTLDININSFGGGLLAKLEDADDPAVPSNKADLDSRMLTSAGKNFNTSAVSGGGTLLTGNFAVALQEVIDRGGWGIDQAINIIFTSSSPVNGINESKYYNGVSLVLSFTPPTATSWTAFFSNSYWTALVGSWNVNKWDAALGGRPNTYKVSLAVAGTWMNAFRPTKIRVAHDFGSPCTLTLISTGANTICTSASYSSGDELTLDWTNNEDIYSLTIDSGQDVSGFSVTNIEFYM